MEDKIELVEIGKDERSKELIYKFVIATNGEKWKEKYRMRCIVNETEPLEQGMLSDYEYCIQTYPNYQNTEDNIHYFLVVNGEPVTKIVLRKDLLDLVDITFSTPTIYSRKGYATKSVELIEQLLFSKENVRGLKLIDLFSTGNATSKIAQKLGFDKIEGNTFIKYNPRYQQKIETIGNIENIENIENEGETK